MLRCLFELSIVDELRLALLLKSQALIVLPCEQLVNSGACRSRWHQIVREVIGVVRIYVTFVELFVRKLAPCCRRLLQRDPVDRRSVIARNGDATSSNCIT